MDANANFSLITGGYDQTIRFFEPSSQTPVRSLQFCDQIVLRLALSARGPISPETPLFLVAGGSPSVMVFDITQPENHTNLFTVFQHHVDAVTAVGFEPNNTSFVWSASEDGTLRTWIPELAAQPYGNPRKHPMMYRAKHFPSVPCKFINSESDVTKPVPIHDALYYPAGDLFFTADWQGRLRIWDHATTSLLSTHDPHPSHRNLQCLDMSHDYTIICAANFDGIVFVYQVDQLLLHMPARAKPRIFRAHDSYIPRIKLSQTGAMLACTSRRGPIKIFRMTDIMSCTATNTKDLRYTVAPIREFSGRQGAIWDASFIADRDEYVLTGGSHSQVMLWDLNDLDRSNAYTGHPKAVTCVAVKQKLGLKKWSGAIPRIINPAQ